MGSEMCIRDRLNGIDSIGIVSDITMIISKESNVNMRTVHFETKDGITVLIRKKALNANDQIAIRNISGELYIGYEVEEQ